MPPSARSSSFRSKPGGLNPRLSVRCTSSSRRSSAATAGFRRANASCTDRCPQRPPDPVVELEEVVRVHDARTAGQRAALCTSSSPYVAARQRLRASSLRRLSSSHAASFSARRARASWSSNLRTRVPRTRRGTPGRSRCRRTRRSPASSTGSNRQDYALEQSGRPARRPAAVTGWDGWRPEVGRGHSACLTTEPARAGTGLAGAIDLVDGTADAPPGIAARLSGTTGRLTWSAASAMKRLGRPLSCSSTSRSVARVNATYASRRSPSISPSGSSRQTCCAHAARSPSWAGRKDHEGPLAALGPVDGGELDALLVEVLLDDVAS